MIKEDRTMREIHKIREKMHEVRKGMPNRKVVEKINDSVRLAEKKYGLKILTRHTRH